MTASLIGSTCRRYASIAALGGVRPDVGWAAAAHPASPAAHTPIRASDRTRAETGALARRTVLRSDLMSGSCEIDGSLRKPVGGRAAGELQARGQLRTALVSVVAAGALVVLKLSTGLVVGSLGLVSAGIESSGDVVAAVLTLFAIRLGGRPADADHPYGHRRAENLAALGEAAILTGGGVVVVVEAIKRLAGSGRPFDARWYVGCSPSSLWRSRSI